MTRAGAFAFPRTRPWTDWVGLGAFSAIAVAVWRQSSEFGILILPAVLQELLVAISFLLRHRPRRTIPGWAPRFVAYGNTFVIMAFLLLAGRYQPEWLAPTANFPVRLAGLVLWLLGALLGFWPLWHLRRSFSVEPVARGLVTSGPYRLARHPVYAVYLLINTGIFLGHLTLPFALILAIWIGLLLVRIRYEESVLLQAFPEEYQGYCRRVGAFGPRPSGARPSGPDR